MTNSSNRTSCRGLFKESGILPLCSQYILSLALFVAKNMDDFIINSNIHPHNTRSNTNLPFISKVDQISKRGLLLWHQGLQLFTYKNKTTVRGCKKIQTGTKKVSFSWILLFHKRIFRMDYPRWPKCFVLVMIVELAGLSTLSYLCYLPYYFIQLIYYIYYPVHTQLMIWTFGTCWHT
jgi:hypothetical protein